jgi:hypothetical protein
MDQIGGRPIKKQAKALVLVLGGGDYGRESLDCVDIEVVIQDPDGMASC